MDKQAILRAVDAALAEDIGSGDVTASLLPPGQQLNAKIIAREPLLVCGQPWVNAVFECLDKDIKIEWLVPEGSFQDRPVTLCQIQGLSSALLTGERSALNFLQTLSATATQTYRILQQLKGSTTKLLDTRKTLPGLRYAQKYAVSCAGAMNHRMGLYDGFLIKENHIAAYGSIPAVIAAARQAYPQLFLEIEVQTLEELSQALTCKPDRILLDNFNEEMIQQALALNHPKICPLEVSGGIDESNIAKIAGLGLDYISMGALTKSIRAIDLSLLVTHASD